LVGDSRQESGRFLRVSNDMSTAGLWREVGELVVKAERGGKMGRSQLRKDVQTEMERRKCRGPP